MPRELGLVDEIGNLQDTIRAAADQADLKDYEISYITQPPTTRERLIKRLNRFILGILEPSQSTRHPAKKLYDMIFDRNIDDVLLAENPLGIYAFCLNCIEP